MSALARSAFSLTAVSLLIALGFAASARRTSQIVHVGRTEVRLITIAGAGGATYFHPHENEHTSAAVTRAFVREKGGTLLEIQSKGARLISFTLAGAKYAFDPNRMFTDTGLRQSLANHSRYSEAAAIAVRSLRNVVLSDLKRSGGPIVAVHNNARDGMTIDDYRQGGRFAKEAKRVAANPSAGPHDFFLVLDEKLFSKLEHFGFNVVLQTQTPTDDGSLSVYCGQHGLRYINIEAGDGHASEQKRMLEALRPLL
ncbi:MAG TPA: hypothetical protein VK604_24475 [Bryobacteraceae bacterium]|nr:hypothetical protein [Bryobacteraceae bacterium]